MSQTLAETLEISYFMNQSRLKIQELMTPEHPSIEEIYNEIIVLRKFVERHQGKITQDNVEIYHRNFSEDFKSKLYQLGGSNIALTLVVLNNQIPFKRPFKDHTPMPGDFLNAEYRVIHEWLNVQAQLIEHHPKLARELLQICKNQIERFKILEKGSKSSTLDKHFDLINTYFRTPSEMKNMAKIGSIHTAIQPEIYIPFADMTRYEFLKQFNDSSDMQLLISKLAEDMDVLSGRQSVERVILKQDEKLPPIEMAYRLLFQFEPLLERFPFDNAITKGKMQMLLSYAYPEIFQWDENLTEIQPNRSHSGILLENIFSKKYDSAFVSESETGKKKALSLNLGHFKAKPELPDFLQLLRCFQAGLSPSQKIERYVDYISNTPNKENARFAAEVLNYLLTFNKLSTENMSPQNYEAIIHAVESAGYRQAMKNVMSTMKLKPESDEISIAKQFRNLKGGTQIPRLALRAKLVSLFNWLDLDKIYGENLLHTKEIKKEITPLVIEKESLAGPSIELPTEHVDETKIESITKTQVSSETQRDNLLAAIRQGTGLKKVEVPAMEPSEPKDFLAEIRRGKKLKETKISGKKDKGGVQDELKKSALLEKARQMRQYIKPEESDSDSGWDDEPESSKNTKK